MKFLSHPTLDNFDVSGKGSNKNSWVASAGLISAAMAGAGVVCMPCLPLTQKLAIPMAVNESGWIGILLLVLCGILSNVTANLLGEAMFHMEGLRECVLHVVVLNLSYADIGEKAFGRVGRVVTTVTQYATLTGITIIYLILLGV
jgi:hypothetical protein